MQNSRELSLSPINKDIQGIHIELTYLGHHFRALNKICFRVQKQMESLQKEQGR